MIAKNLRKKRESINRLKRGKIISEAPNSRSLIHPTVECNIVKDFVRENEADLKKKKRIIKSRRKL